MKEQIQLEIRIARKRSEILQCQYLIAAIYNRHYDIVFSAEGADLDAKIEPYPHYYVMGLVDGELIACAGLYVRETYVERYGQVDDAEIQQLLRQAQAENRYSLACKHEYTKLVVRQDFEGRGIGRFFFAATHTRDFLQLDTTTPALLVVCAKLSIFRNLYDIVGIHTRRIRPFPIYRVHERYSSVEDPMESRLIIPDLDIDKRWYDRQLPGIFPVESFGEHP